MKLIELTLPASWACALMYGDLDSLEQDEVDAIDQIQAQYEGDAFHCVDVADTGEFMRWHDAGHVWPYASDCARYTFDLG